MRALLRGLRRNERPRRFPSTCYRSSTYTPLSPGQVRGRRFRATRLGRRGLDPAEVTEFLDRVADDLASAYRAPGESRRETARIRDALRRWQSEQAQQRQNAGRYR
ncbi:DivIVA domain-containing protein [Micromonospora auratinigra]|uniref:DivIVA domain-containing protein n=1 Tax=Micromonospora auratinigra TaxID=261654 RepID=A0A1A8ZTU5_9ACTN|nr:DivIVA domain-containing protein [Micromonospora auratinigra]SBT47331.1 DivIVA domain-containing protein [Micromonospora auratinigra]